MRTRGRRSNLLFATINLIGLFCIKQRIDERGEKNKYLTSIRLEIILYQRMYTRGPRARGESLYICGGLKTAGRGAGTRYYTNSGRANDLSSPIVLRPNKTFTRHIHLYIHIYLTHILKRHVYTPPTLYFKSTHASAFYTN